MSLFSVCVLTASHAKEARQKIKFLPLALQDWNSHSAPSLWIFEVCGGRRCFGCHTHKPGINKDVKTVRMERGKHFNRKGDFLIWKCTTCSLSATLFFYIYIYKNGWWLMVCLCATNANKDTWGCLLADDSSSDSCICFALTKKKQKKFQASSVKWFVGRESGQVQDTWRAWCLPGH